MTSSQPPQIDCEYVIPALPVADVLAAADFYVRNLGFSPGFTWGEPVTLAGVNLGNISIHLTQANADAAPCSVYFIVEDADQLFEFQRANGVEVVEPPADRPYGLRDYRIRDPYGNSLGFGHYIAMTEPALEIERVDVPIRLEKRLAALLQDLAAFKGLSLAGCVEETLLHSFDYEEGGGIHSPHSKRQLSYIQKLKQKHGIDYDSHASYRFREK
jgi:uncharacterized glyoxalase superfamily protein PhnB